MLVCDGMWLIKKGDGVSRSLGHFHMEWDESLHQQIEDEMICHT